MPDEEQRQPWIKFYPADWRSDEALRLCSLAARGLWMECLALMHKGTPYGHLSFTGCALTARDLAVLVCASVGDVKRLQDELLRHNVPSVTPQGVWFSRRLIRDRDRSKRGAENGAQGGNPAMLGASVPKSERPKRLNRANNPTKVTAVWESCGGRCFYCGCEMTRDDPYRPDAFQIDHAIPIAEGGTNDLANLRGACRRCNFAKGIGVPVNHSTEEVNGDSVNVHTALRVRVPEARSQKLDQNPNQERTALASGDAALLERFNRFWMSYPRKDGRKPALKIWQRLKPSDATTDLLVAAVERQCRSKQWRDKQFIPHAATWLSQERWEDEGGRALPPEPCRNGSRRALSPVCDHDPPCTDGTDACKHRQLDEIKAAMAAPGAA